MEEERVKEEMARFLQSVDPDHGWVKWDELTPFYQHVFLTRAGAILSIKGIRIESADQDLPANPYGAAKNIEVYHRAIHDFVKADSEGRVRVKCLPRKVK